MWVLRGTGSAREVPKVLTSNFALAARLCATIASSSALRAPLRLLTPAVFPAVEFTLEVIETVLTVQLSVFSGRDMLQVNPVLEPFFLRSVVHLCISGELSRCRLAGLRC